MSVQARGRIPIPRIWVTLAPDDVPEPHYEPGEIPDELLRLIFTCCHPALAQDAQVALTLRTLWGARDR